MSQLRSIQDSDWRSDEAVLQELGERLARERLNRNQTQAELAAQAGISRATVRRLEAGHSTQLTNWIRVLRALQLLDNLEALLPEAPPSPIQQAKQKQPRQRASSPRSSQPPEGDQSVDSSKPESSDWKWGDER